MVEMVLFKRSNCMKQVVLIISLIIGMVSGVMAQNIENHNDMNLIDSVKTHKELYIPNAFTPNGDGLNDVFKILNLTEEKVIDFRVFNRWGTILYRSGDNQAAWDGKYKGKIQDPGVYGYLMKIGHADGSIVTYKGTIMLIR